MDERQKKLVADASAFAIMAAMEFGYKACERGLNIQQAWAELIDTVGRDTLASRAAENAASGATGALNL